MEDRPQRVPCRGQIAAAGGEPAAHNGDAGVADGLVGVGERVGEPQLGRGNLVSPAQERDRGRWIRDRVEKVQVGAWQGGRARSVCERRRRRHRGARDRVLPHLRAGDARQQSLGGGAARASLIEQGLGVVVAVHELQRGDLAARYGAPVRARSSRKCRRATWWHPRSRGCLAGRLHRQGECFPVAAVAGLLDRAGRSPAASLARVASGCGPARTPRAAAR